MHATESKREKWVSWSLIIGAALAGLAALAVQKRGAAAGAPPLPPPTAPRAEGPKPPAPAPAPAPTPPTPPARPRVDVVFALDTTGSMSGLIEGAKRKIWALASFVARAQPTPELRVGLVAYRDVGDDYVTRTYDLDADLDRVYRRLLSFHAAGGGDGPEHVARALTEAVRRMSWSRAQNGGPPQANDKAVRLIYLVGDAPPHTDYQDGYDYARAARDAARMGIQVHAIRCGADPETATYWRRIASLGHGEFLTIDQDGGMRDTTTPYDDELARLHDEVSGTMIPFGAGATELRRTLSAVGAAAPSVKAARAAYGAVKKESTPDLVEMVASGKVNLADVPSTSLPRDLAALPEPERKAKLEADAHDRQKLADRIARLAKDRDAYLRGHDKGGPSGFDGEVERTMRHAGTAIGLAF